MDDGGQIFSRGSGWEVVAYAQQCDAFSAEQSAGISIELWNDGKARLYFNHKNAGSLKDGETRRLTLHFDGVQVLDEDFEIFSQPDRDEDELSVSTYLDGALFEKLKDTKLVEFRYKGRVVKVANFIGFGGAAQSLRQCIDSIYRRDPFID